MVCSRLHCFNVHNRTFIGWQRRENVMARLKVYFCTKVHSLVCGFVGHQQPHEKIDKRVVNARNSFSPTFHAQCISACCFTRRSREGWARINLWKPSTISRLMESRNASLSPTFYYKFFCGQTVACGGGNNRNENKKPAPGVSSGLRNFFLHSENSVELARKWNLKFSVLLPLHQFKVLN